MNYSTHYNLNLAEGTDLVNPLTTDVPNYVAIDNQMFANEQTGVGTATELKSGTIHAITRANQNQSSFKFRATSNFVAGDTFTVDGNVVTALNVNGSSLAGGCFIIGSEVLCSLVSSQLTIIGTYVPIASDVAFDDTNVSYTATNVQGAIENASTADGTEYSTGVSVKDKIDDLAGSPTTLLSQQQLTLSDTSYLLNDDISKYRIVVFAVSWSGGMPSNYLFTLAGAIKNGRVYLNANPTADYADIVTFADSTHVTLKATNTNIFINIYGLK